MSKELLCCGKPMKKLKDTLYKIDRFECSKCNTKLYTNLLEGIDVNLAWREDKNLSAFINEQILARLNQLYVTNLKCENSILLKTPDNKLTMPRLRRKQSIQRIIGYWEKIHGKLVDRKNKKKVKK